MANKIKKVIKVKKETNDDIKFKELIIVFIVMIIATGGVYYLTDNLVAKNKKDTDSQSSSEIEINNKIILLSELLSQKDKKYYVLTIDFKADYYDDYKTLVTDYESKNKTNIYQSNLSDGLNKKYVSEKSNKNVKKINDLKIAGPTLILVEDGKITGYYEGSKEITKILK